MGGGGAMRTAAKAAMAGGGGGMMSSAFRSGVASPPAEHAMRQAAMPASTLSASATGGGGTSVAQRGSAPWETDDWEFAGGVEDEFVEMMEMPRVVFGRVPSFDEANEAAGDLKEAIEQVYLSPEKSRGSESSYSVAQGSGLALLTKSECMETKSSVSTVTTMARSIPNQALHAFKFLSETPQAQNVVASIASDPHVWNAVLQNPALVDFMHSYKSDAVGHNSVTTADKSSDPSQSGSSVNELLDILQNIKITVVQLMNRVSDFLQNIFAPSAAEKTVDSDGHSRLMSTEKALGSSIFGLAVLAIMVVVLKRN